MWSRQEAALGVNEHAAVRSACVRLSVTPQCGGDAANDACHRSVVGVVHQAATALLSMGVRGLSVGGQFGDACIGENTCSAQPEECGVVAEFGKAADGRFAIEIDAGRVRVSCPPLTAPQCAFFGALCAHAVVLCLCGRALGTHVYDVSLMASVDPV